MNSTNYKESFLPKSIENRLRNWWDNGDQEHPCLIGSVPPEMEPVEDLNRFWLDSEYIINRKIYEIENTRYYGCSVPYHYVDHGSSAMAGVLGCPLEFIDAETIWAHEKFKSIDDVFNVEFDADAKVYSHIRDLTSKTVELAGSHHHVAMFALEGMTDLMAALYGLENFLMDIITQPDVVKKAFEHLKNIWFKAFEDMSALIGQSGNPGGIGWLGVWAPGTTFPLQEDVAYNISPDMFAEFCIPVIREQVELMGSPFFHLDGVGMIGHLDSLLEIEKLKVIQWQPGAGKEDLSQWYELLGKILKAGKSVQVYARSDDIEPLISNLGSRGVLAIITDATDEKMQKLLDKYPQD